MDRTIADDIAAISGIDAVPTILDVVCLTTGMGFAAVARVTDDRWVACSVRDDIAFGLKPGGELKLETTICNEIRSSRQAVVIDHVANDPLFAHHHTPLMYGFQSYISMPITLADGSFFGTLCAIDPRPARLNNPATIGMFKLFADLIAFHLEAQRRLSDTEASLMSERQSSELREQFIAVLGHDLRNPLASIDAGTRLLLRNETNEKSRSILGLMQASAGRMSGLINNVLDLARGRLGGGIAVDRKEPKPIQPMLEQVVSELRLSAPSRAIEVHFSDLGVLSCDQSRIGQMLSNLVANALTHGAPDSPIKVEASMGEGGFQLSVSNEGTPIPAGIMADLFKPFFRAAAQPSLQGLGLGLYISSEIAKAHDGTLTAVSTRQETSFRFQMPIV